MDEDRGGTDRAITVLTCKGDITDPCFPARLQHLVCKLHRLVDDGRGREFEVTKVEPWNSVRVTFNISKESARRLRRLAEVGDESLRDLGILSVQVDGDQVITLTLANSSPLTTLPAQNVVLNKVSSPPSQHPNDVISSISSTVNSSLPSSTTPLITAQNSVINAQTSLSSTSSSPTRVSEDDRGGLGSEEESGVGGPPPPELNRVCTVNVAQYLTSGRDRLRTSSPHSLSSLSSTSSPPSSTTSHDTRPDSLVSCSNSIQQNNTHEMLSTSSSTPKLLLLSSSHDSPVKNDQKNNSDTTLSLPLSPSCKSSKQGTGIANQSCNIHLSPLRKDGNSHFPQPDSNHETTPSWTTPPHAMHEHPTNDCQETRKEDSSIKNSTSKSLLTALSADGEPTKSPLLVQSCLTLNCSGSTHVLRVDGPSEDSPPAREPLQNELFKSIVVEGPVNKHGDGKEDSKTSQEEQKERRNGSCLKLSEEENAISSSEVLTTTPSSVRLRKDYEVNRPSSFNEDVSSCLHEDKDSAAPHVQDDIVDIVSSLSSCNNVSPSTTRNSSTQIRPQLSSLQSLQSDDPVSPQLTSTPDVQKETIRVVVDSNNDDVSMVDDALNHNSMDATLEGDTASTGDGDRVLSRDSLLSDSSVSSESKSDSTTTREEELKETNNNNGIPISTIVSTSRSSSVDELLSSESSSTRPNSDSPTPANFVITHSLQTTSTNITQNHSNNSNSILNFSHATTNCISSVLLPVTSVPHHHPPQPAATATGLSILATSLIVAPSDEESSEPLVPPENVNGTHSNDGSVTDHHSVPSEATSTGGVIVQTSTTTITPATLVNNTTRSSNRSRRKSSSSSSSHDKKVKSHHHHHREVIHSVASGDHNYICVTKDDHHATNNRNHNNSLSHGDVDGFDEDFADAIVGRFSDLNKRPNKRRKVSGS